MAKSKSPTQRTLEHLRADGWEVGIVEKWNQHTHTRHDLFGFMDLLAYRGDEVMGIQATSGSNVAARIAKIKAEPRAKTWLRLQAGRRIVVIGWKKYKKEQDGKFWCHTWREINASDLEAGGSDGIACDRSCDDTLG